MHQYLRDKLYAVETENYGEQLLKENIKKIFAEFKVDEKISPGDRVLMKVNLLMGKDPSRAVCTHPAVVRAVAGEIKALGGRPVLADSPGGPFNQAALKLAYNRSGYTEDAGKGLYELNYNTGSFYGKLESGRRGKSFELCSFIRKADFIINLPKLKTHGLTLYTGAVKNLFGVVPGTVKAGYHFKMPKIRDFCQLLLDIAELVDPDLTIMDAVTGMEGSGPSSGTPRDFKLLLAASDILELDLLVSWLLRGDPSYRNDPLPEAILRRYSQSGESESYGRYGEGNFLKEEIPDWLTRKFREIKLPDIDRTANLLDKRMPDFLKRIVTRLVRPRPVFTSACIGCGICKKNCPPQVISMEQGQARVELEGCIRCFCCQELCPHMAVEIENPLLGRLFF